MRGGRATKTVIVSRSARRSYLVSIEELVGKADPSKWRSQYRAACVECQELTFGWGSIGHMRWSLYSSSALFARIRAGLYTEQIEALERVGTSFDDSEALIMLLIFGAAIGRALRESRPSLAPSCHALGWALARVAKAREAEMGVAPPLYLPMFSCYDSKGSGGRINIMPGLADVEPAFSSVEVADATGFKGQVLYSPHGFIYDTPQVLSEHGFNRFESRLAKSCAELSAGLLSFRWAPADTDVACILSRPRDDSGFHSAVKYATWVGNEMFALPPNTLLRLVSVQEPPFTATFRRWAVHIDSEGRQVLVDRCGGGDGTRDVPVEQWRYYRSAGPAAGHGEQGGQGGGGRVRYEEMRPIKPHLPMFGVVPASTAAEDALLLEAEVGYDPAAVVTKVVHRRLLTFTLTFMLPSLDGDAVRAMDRPSEEEIAAADRLGQSKFGASVRMLTYLDRQAYTRGTEELTDGLSHTMSDEWLRGDGWTDWKGVAYNGRASWEYVHGEAFAADKTPGRRDVNHEGRSLSGFVRLAEDLIRASSATAELLNEEEVVAIRLYTGEAYQPINTWLRRVGAMATAAERRAAALDRASSFGATVGRLISAIRKLSAAQQGAAARMKLYRGLCGALPSSFWLEDAQGFVCATDTAFMSTSSGEATPIHYMAAAPKPNLLWEIRCRAEDDAGFHFGADISFLSQYCAEAEYLFPPLTMLRVVERDTPTPATTTTTIGAHGDVHEDDAAVRADGGSTAASLEDRIRASRERLQTTLESNAPKEGSGLSGSTSSAEEARVAADGTRIPKEWERVVVVPTYTG